MALKAGRVGVAPDQVDPYGKISGGGGGGYVLPPASADTLGGIKVGTGLTMTDGVLSSDNPTPYTLPTASADTFGGIKVGAGLTMTDGVLSAVGGGKLYKKVFATKSRAQVASLGLWRYITGDITLDGYTPIGVFARDKYSGYDNIFISTGLYYYVSYNGATIQTYATVLTSSEINQNDAWDMNVIYVANNNLETLS